MAEIEFKYDVLSPTAEGRSNNMEIKIEKIKVPIIISESPLQLLIYVASCSYTLKNGLLKKKI
jgi:hypothetical protein